jgi:hypothetical protein
MTIDDSIQGLPRIDGQVVILTGARPASASSSRGRCTGPVHLVGLRGPGDAPDTADGVRRIQVGSQG